MTSNSEPRKRSLLLSFLARTNFTVTALTALAIVLTRSAGVTYFVAGALTTSLSVKLVVKKIIRQPRPVGKKKTYGMPSTHSASIAFYATYISLAALYLPLHPTLPAAARLFPVIALPWAALIAVSRVLLGHHTWAQVGAGCAYGVTFALGWYQLWTRWRLDEYGRMGEELVKSVLW